MKKLYFSILFFLSVSASYAVQQRAYVNPDAFDEESEIPKILYENPELQMHRIEQFDFNSIRNEVIYLLKKAELLENFNE